MTGATGAYATCPVAGLENGDVAMVLARGLRDDARGVREAAALGLAALGDPRAPEDVDAGLGQDPDDCGVP